MYKYGKKRFFEISDFIKILKAVNLNLGNTNHSTKNARIGAVSYNND